MNHELSLHVERSGFRSTVEERNVRSQTHIEGRPQGALEHFAQLDNHRPDEGDAGDAVATLAPSPAYAPGELAQLVAS